MSSSGSTVEGGAIVSTQDSSCTAPCGKCLDSSQPDANNASSGSHDQPCSSSGSRDQPHCSGSRDQPHCSSGSHDQPHCSSGSRDQPHCSSGSRDQPHCSSGSHDQPHCSSGSHDQPHCSSGSHDQPRCSSGSRDQPHCSSGSRDQPHCSSGSRDQPHCSSGSRDEPHCSKSEDVAAHSSTPHPPGVAADGSEPVTILISNGSPHHRRAASSASMHSEGHGSTLEPSSSSSSFYELSQNSSFASKELEQLVADLNSASLSGEPMDRNEAVKQLLEHVVTLKLELEELRQENERLKQMRSTMDDELHTLTENLFEEAYKMVDTAKEEKGLAVKKLADAAGKIDAMETEMSVLKTVLHAPPPKDGKNSTVGLSASPHSKHRKPSVKKVIKKLSRKVKLVNKPSLNTAESAIPHTLLEHKNEVKGGCLGEGQIDPCELSVFKDWLADVSRDDHPYLARVMEYDVLPCLDFSNKQLSAQVLTAVKNNDLLMESLPVPSSLEKRECVLSECEDICCTHRMRLAPSRPWQHISQHCRDRIAAVCDFYMYMCHIQKGILKQDATCLYWQMNRLRAQMNLTRLTLLLPD